MNAKWIEILRISGLDPSELSPRPILSASHSAMNSVHLVDLSQLSVVDVTGDDAASFLQSQFCNDVTQVSPSHAQINGYCTPKGRLLALPIVVSIADGYRLLLPVEVKDSFLKRLSMFILRANVTLQERTDCVCSGVIADSSGHLGAVGQYLDSLPDETMQVVSRGDRQVIRWHGSGSSARYLIVASVSEQIAVWQECADVPKLDDASWRLADIHSGVPSIRAATQDAFVPQMLNLHLINGLSFTKGCYPGQEIVARMQYLGKLKRHMQRYEVDFSDQRPDKQPLPGDALTSGADTAAGVVIDAVLDAASDRLELLAVVKVSVDELTLGELLLSEASMPYTLPSAIDD